MEPLYVYLLKLSLCLGLGYGFYYSLLRRMTYYHWNRYYLLLFPLFSLLVPVLPFYPNEALHSLNAVYHITHVLPAGSTVAAGETPQPSGWDFLRVGSLLLIAGYIFFLLRFITRLYSLKRTTRRARLLSDGDIKVYQLEGTEAPFSFYNSIYLDAGLYSEMDLQNIIAHETVHVLEKHTMDMLFTEVLCILQWFNPFAWLLKNAVRQNLEFIADEQVLQNGCNRKNYQYLLLKVSGAMPQSLANNLLFPSLKKRIHMMNRAKTRRVHLLKFICIVPLACLLLLAFSGPATRSSAPREVNGIEAFSLTSLSFYINDEQVAAIVKKEQQKSFLKPGGPLSLSLISEEKARLASLLQKNGYDNITPHSITFVMDTSATTKSFSVQVSIQVNRKKALVAGDQRENTWIVEAEPYADKRMDMADKLKMNN